MILDRLENAERYFPLHAGFQSACEFVRRTDFASFAAGRHEIDGERMFLMVNRTKGRGRKEAKLEAHKKYIDIQCTLAGDEEIGWRPLQACQQVLHAYDPENDYHLFSDEPTTWIAVPAGHFTIFFPNDAHAPLGASADCQLLKAVVKVAVDWK